MKIDCILKMFAKTKGKQEKLVEIEQNSAEYYTNAGFDVTYSLQIVAINKNNEIKAVLAENIFVPDGKSVRYVHFLDVTYQYDETKDLIYTTNTKMEI